MSVQEIATVTTLYAYQNVSPKHYPGCGIPPFCSSSVKSICSNITLRHCEECDFGEAVAFGFFVTFIGLLMIALNSFVLWYCLSKKDFRSYDKIRASLAVADILTGFQLSILAVYNLAWFINLTVKEVQQIQLDYSNSPQTNMGGIVYILCVCSSLNHLVYMGGQRIYAINWPLDYRLQKKRNVAIGLICVWIISLLSAAAPVMLTNHVSFTYSQATMLFTIARLSKKKKDSMALLAILLIIVVLPFILMTTFTVTSVFVLRRRNAQSRKLRNQSSANANKARNKREVQVFVTVALMQFSFIFTLVPIVVVMVLNLAEVYSCSRTSRPYSICFYISMLNSLVNVLVYLLREKPFRKIFFNIFFSRTSKIAKLDNNGAPSRNAAITSNQRLSSV